MAALPAAFGVACGSSQLALQLVDPAQPHRGSQFLDWGSALLGCTSTAWTQSCSMGQRPAGRLGRRPCRPGFRHELGGAWAGRAELISEAGWGVGDGAQVKREVAGTRRAMSIQPRSHAAPAGAVASPSPMLLLYPPACRRASAVGASGHLDWRRTSHPTAALGQNKARVRRSC